MLRPSRPMIRPFISSDGRWTTETVCSAVWSAATRWMAVTTMSRALSWASSRARALDRAGDLDRVVLGLLADGLDEDALGVLGGHVGDPLERGDLLGMGAGEVLAGLVELALAVEQLAVALLEHVGALVELLVALEEPALEAGQLGAPGAGLLLGLALHPQLLVLGLEDQLLLAGAGLGFDAARLGGRRLHRLGGPEAAQEYANGDAANGGQRRPPPGGAGVPSSVPPVRPIAGRTCVMRWAARSRVGLGSSRRRVVPPWAAIEPVLWSAPPERHVVRLVRSLRRAPRRVNRLLRATVPRCAGLAARLAEALRGLPDVRRPRTRLVSRPGPVDPG